MHQHCLGGNLMQAFGTLGTQKQLETKNSPKRLQYNDGPQKLRKGRLAMKSEEFFGNKKSICVYIAFALMTTAPESNNRSCRLLNIFIYFYDTLWLV
jgi:hypothetical protein